jgi:hypothetical protein
MKRVKAVICDVKHESKFRITGRISLYVRHDFRIDLACGVDFEDVNQSFS